MLALHKTVTRDQTSALRAKVVGFKKHRIDRHLQIMLLDLNIGRSHMFSPPIGDPVTRTKPFLSANGVPDPCLTASRLVLLGLQRVFLF